MSDLIWANEKRKLSDLVPWPRNPRQIREDQAARLSESLDQFGQVDVIAIGPDGEVYNGHQRINVWAADHGANFEVDVRVASRELTEKEREKLTVFLHKGAAGEWDFDTLANEFELDELLEWGFEERDLELDLWHQEPPDDPGAQIDKAEELQEKWQVQRGQVWQVGRHRLMCGDSTSAEDVGRLMGEERAFCFTDPPYNVGKEYGENVNDSMSEGEYLSWSVAWFSLAQQYCDAVVFTPGAVNIWMWPGIKRPKWLAIWVKKNQNSRNGAGGWNAYEPILCYGNVKIDYDVWEGSVKIESIGHIVNKTLEPWRVILDDVAKDARAILDLFVGQGTTLVACEQTGRIGYGMEIEPKYCAVTLERLTGMGLDAKLIE